MTFRPVYSSEAEGGGTVFSTVPLTFLTSPETNSTENIFSSCVGIWGGHKDSVGEGNFLEHCLSVEGLVKNKYFIERNCRNVDFGKSANNLPNNFVRRLFLIRHIHSLLNLMVENTFQITWGDNETLNVTYF